MCDLGMPCGKPECPWTQVNERVKRQREEAQRQKNKDFADVMHFAFRYALTRQTYAGALVADFIRQHADVFTTQQLAQIAIEITEAEQRGDINEFDFKLWVDLRTWVDARINAAIEKLQHGSALH